MPKILDAMVKKLKAKGFAESKAIAIATSKLQQAGELKPGTTTATPLGLKRGNMTHAQRAKTREFNRKS